MEKIPTAEEILRNKYKLEGERGTLRIDQVSTFMIEFAKLHVEAALKEASEKAETYYVEEDGCATGDYYEVDKQSILNSYSLDNIK